MCQLYLLDDTDGRQLNGCFAIHRSSRCQLH